MEIVDPSYVNSLDSPNEDYFANIIDSQPIIPQYLPLSDPALNGALPATSIRDCRRGPWLTSS